jgi:hypothetical protein
MADPGQDFTLCDAVAAQPVRDDALRPVFQAMQQPFEESLRRLRVPLA